MVRTYRVAAVDEHLGLLLGPLFALLLVYDEGVVAPARLPAVGHGDGGVVAECPGGYEAGGGGEGEGYAAGVFWRGFRGHG